MSNASCMIIILWVELTVYFVYASLHCSATLSQRHLHLYFIVTEYGDILCQIPTDVAINLHLKLVIIGNSEVSDILYLYTGE